MVALSRPGLAIGLVLLLFFVLDENTDDVLPVLGRAGDELYGDYLGGLLADRDVLLVICAVLAVVFFPAAEDRRRRVFGSVTWVFIAVGACIVAGLVVGFYALTGPVGSLIGLRPYYTCVLAAFIVWRVLRSMPRERAEKAIFWSATVVGIVLIVIGAVRVLRHRRDARRDRGRADHLLRLGRPLRAALLRRRLGRGPQRAPLPRRAAPRAAAAGPRRADGRHRLAAARDPAGLRDRRGGAAGPERRAPARRLRALRAGGRRRAPRPRRGGAAGELHRARREGRLRGAREQRPDGRRGVQLDRPVAAVPGERVGRGLRPRGPPALDRHRPARRLHAGQQHLPADRRHLHPQHLSDPAAALRHLGHHGAHRPGDRARRGAAARAPQLARRARPGSWPPR